jgi:hypothetical protein
MFLRLLEVDHNRISFRFCKETLLSVRAGIFKLLYIIFSTTLKGCRDNAARYSMQFVILL